MKKKQALYFNQKTGNLKSVTKAQAKLLPPDYKPILFVKNDKGERVMRFNFDGATVDVQENIVPAIAAAVTKEKHGN